MPKRRKIKPEAEQEETKQRYHRLFKEDSSFTSAGQRLHDEVRSSMAVIMENYIGEYPSYEIEAVIHKVNFNPIFNIICKNARRF